MPYVVIGQFMGDMRQEGAETAEGACEAAERFLAQAASNIGITIPDGRTLALDTVRAMMADRDAGNSSVDLP